jgi:hypothetical protein
MRRAPTRSLAWRRRAGSALPPHRGLARRRSGRCRR